MSIPATGFTYFSCYSMKRLFILLLALFPLFPGKSLFVHSMFIQSGQYIVKKGKDSPLFFSYGHIVPFGDGLRSEKIAAISVWPPDEEMLKIPVRQGKGLQSHMVRYNKAGIWMLTAQTNPGYYTVYKDKQGQEHHAIKPIDEIKNDAAEILLSYLSKQYAKTYVVCESPAQKALPVAGADLELMPSADIFSVKAGQSVQFQVLKDGKPFSGTGSWDATFAGFSTQPEDLFYPPTTIEGDRFTLFIAHPGRWYVRYNTKIPAPESAKEIYRQMKLATSFVFQVDNEPRRRATQANNVN